jgi:integrase
LCKLCRLPGSPEFVSPARPRWPARGIDKFKEGRRERFLTSEELERLGSAIRETETTGPPWAVDETKPTAKHVLKTRRLTRIAPSAAAALRLLLFTGCRVREILHLRWEHVDIERGRLLLPDSKSGRMTVILTAPSLAVLNGLERVGAYAVPGDDPEQPRHDLKRPLDAVTKRAGRIGVRLHDLRHTYASFGAGGGLGFPIIGRLLGARSGIDDRALRILITARCGMPLKRLQGVSRLLWMEIGKQRYCHFVAALDDQNYDRFALRMGLFLASSRSSARTLRLLGAW